MGLAVPRMAPVSHSKRRSAGRRKSPDHDLRRQRCVVDLYLERLGWVTVCKESLRYRLLLTGIRKLWGTWYPRLRQARYQNAVVDTPARALITNVDGIARHQSCKAMSDFYRDTNPFSL